MKDYSVLEGLDRNFINELRCAYDRGYRHGRDDEWAETQAKPKEEEGYKRGMESAWSCAKRIMTMPLSDQEKIFNMQDERAIMDAHSAEEAIDILKRYDEKNDDIKVGDKVRILKESDGFNKLFPIGTVGIVEIVGKDNKLKYKISANGDYWWYRRDMIELVKDDEIEVGDEIICYGVGQKAVVFEVLDDNNYKCFSKKYGVTTEDSKSVKTGRRFPEMVELIKHMENTDA